MPMILLKLLDFTRWLKQALWRALSLARTYPLQTALIASLVFSVWLWRGWIASDAGWEAERLAHAETIKAGQQAYAAQVALNKAAEAKSAAIAKDQDDAHEKQLALANDRTERWIDANRVRPEKGRTSATSAPAEDQTAGLHQEVPTDAVMVGAADLRICTARSVDAMKAYDLGQALIKAGLAE